MYFEDGLDARMINFISESNWIEGEKSVGILLTQHIEAFKFITGVSVLTENTILETHRILMNGLVDGNDLGVYRNRQVRVGSYYPPKPETVGYNMSEFVENYNTVDDKRDIRNCIRRHRRFESIHPFIDGNGRVGRLIYAHDVLRNGFSLLPTLHGFKGNSIHEKKESYYTFLSQRPKEHHESKS